MNEFNGVLAKGFGVRVSSEQGRNDVDVQYGYQSNQPAKQMAELTLLECGFLDWARQERIRLARAIMLGQPHL